MIPAWLSPVQPIERRLLLALPIDHVLSCLDTLADADPWEAPFGIAGPPLTVRTRKADAQSYVLRLSQTARRPRQQLPHYDCLVECAPVPQGTELVLMVGRQPEEVWFSALVLGAVIPIMFASLLAPAVRGLLALALLVGWWAVQRLLVHRATRHLTKRLADYLAHPPAG